MTEWTRDLTVPVGDAADIGATTAPRDAAVAGASPPPDSPGRDLVPSAIIDDVQLDMAEWFP